MGISRSIPFQAPSKRGLTVSVTSNSPPDNTLQLHIETTQHKGTRISRQEAHGFNEAQEDQAGENVDEMWTSSGFHDRIAGTIHARTAPVAAHAGWFWLTSKTGGRQSWNQPAMKLVGTSCVFAL